MRRLTTTGALPLRELKAQLDDNEIEIEDIIRVVGVDKIKSAFYRSLSHGPNTLWW